MSLKDFEDSGDLHQLRVNRFIKLTTLIVEWARERNFLEGSNAKIQHVKGCEETGELVEHMIESFANGDSWDQDALEDDIGDNFVVLVVQAFQERLFPEDLFNLREERNLTSPDLGEVVLTYVAKQGRLAGALCRGNDTTRHLVESFEALHDIVDGCGLDMIACIQTAYDGIKDRKGEWRNGTFVKEADLVK